MERLEVIMMTMDTLYLPVGYMKINIHVPGREQTFLAMFTVHNNIMSQRRVRREMGLLQAPGHSDIDISFFHSSAWAMDVSPMIHKYCIRSSSMQTHM